MAQYDLNVAEISLGNFKDNEDLGFLLLKHKDFGGFDPFAAGEEDNKTLASMNGGAGLAGMEWAAADYSRQACTYVGGGTGVITDIVNDLVKLLPDNYEFPALSPDTGNAAHKVGYVVIYTNHAGATDGDKKKINVIDLQAAFLPTGAPFPVNWPTATGIIKASI